MQRSSPSHSRSPQKAQPTVLAGKLSLVLYTPRHPIPRAPSLIFSVDLPSTRTSQMYTTLISPGQAHRHPQGPGYSLPSSHLWPIPPSHFVQTRWLPLISWNTPVVSASETWRLLFCLECSPPAISRSCFRYHLKGCSWPYCGPILSILHATGFSL